MISARERFFQGICFAKEIIQIEQNHPKSIFRIPFAYNKSFPNIGERVAPAYGAPMPSSAETALTGKYCER
jgi:hypothetical protein